MKADAERVLLRSIYDVDKLTPDIYNRQLGDHIAIASTKSRVRSFTCQLLAKVIRLIYNCFLNASFKENLSFHFMCTMNEDI